MHQLARRLCLMCHTGTAKGNFGITELCTAIEVHEQQQQQKAQVSQCWSRCGPTKPGSDGWKILLLLCTSVRKCTCCVMAGSLCALARLLWMSCSKKVYILEIFVYDSFYHLRGRGVYMEGCTLMQWPELGDDSCRVWTVILAFCISELFWLCTTLLERGMFRDERACVTYVP